MAMFNAQLLAQTIEKTFEESNVGYLMLKNQGTGTAKITFNGGADVLELEPSPVPYMIYNGTCPIDVKLRVKQEAATDYKLIAIYSQVKC